jgi:integrase
LKPSTRRTNKYHLLKYLRPHFGKTLIQDITADHINEAVRTWAKKGGLSHNTLRNFVNTLRSITGKNFGREIKYPSQIEVSDADTPYFTPEQMSQIIEAANNPQMKAFFATAAGTGMRSGELCGLRVEDVGGLHAFRHGRMSFLVENNVSLPMIRLWMGHGSDRMVRRYTHARPEFHANEIAKLPSIANMQTKAA